MCHKPRNPAARQSSVRHQHTGFALPAALFVVVAVGSAVAAMTSLASSQTQASTQALLVERARWAAQSGLELAVFNIMTTNTCTNTTRDIGIFEVAISCTTASLDIIGYSGTTRYSLQASAHTKGQGIDDADYAYRSVQSEILCSNTPPCS